MQPGHLSKILVFVVAFAHVSIQGLPATNPAVWTLDIKMTRPALNRLTADKSSNETTETQMSFGNQTNIPVRVRNRGRWSRTWNKTPLKVFLPTQAIEGRSCLNLNSTFRDPSWVRERLAMHIYSASGVPAPRTRFVEVRINSKFHGLYVDVEQVDSHFFKTRDLQGAEAYKSIGASHSGDQRKLGALEGYPREYEKQTKKKSGYQSLKDFCDALDATRDADAFFQQHIHLDRYVSFLAANILIQNWDGLNKNHVFVREDGQNGKWYVVPWDVDRTFGDWPPTTMGGAFTMTKMPIETGIRKEPGVTGWNRLQDRFWQSPALRSLLAKRLEDLLRTEFTPENLNPLIDAWAAEAAPYVDRDRSKWGGASDQDLQEGIREIKAFIKGRREFVASALPSLRHR